MRFDRGDPVFAMAGAFGDKYAAEAARGVTYRGTVEGHNSTGGWDVLYDADGKVWKTPEKFLSLVPVRDPDDDDDDAMECDPPADGGWVASFFGGW